MYHRFSGPVEERKICKKVFEQQIRYIKRHCHVESFDDVVDALEKGKKHKSNTVVITVDDGYKDFMHYAYPILQKYSVPATVYVTTDFVDNKVWLWPDIIEYILNNTKYNTFDFGATAYRGKADLENRLYMRHQWNDIADYCLTLSNRGRLEYIENLGKELDVEVPEQAVKQYESLDWEDMRRMQNKGISFQSHTCTHPILTSLSRSELLYEIEESKRIIESQLDKQVSAFCYPNGTRKDYNEIIKKQVKKAGYKNATVGFYDKKMMNDLFEIRRFGISPDFLHFTKVVNGLEYLSSYGLLKRKESRGQLG